ncbi:hypothetical protein [Salinicola tamaricis]|uniref:hypothetical protein n=1 Tax=Salinicola tamaricis TaxID=1771309 RepID=UPI00101AD337|nr:hypothetical protein [Salinicola tamaricis]
MRPTEAGEVRNVMASLGLARRDQTETFSQSIGVGGSAPSGSKSFNNGKAIAIGDDDSGIRSGGDGTIEVWANDRKVWTSTNTHSTSDVDVTLNKSRPWLTLDSPNSGDNALSQGAGLSIGESGQRGDAALHLTYVGNGNGYIGMGAVGDDGIPANAAMRLYYRSKDVHFNGRLYGDGSQLDSVNAARLGSLAPASWLRSDANDTMTATLDVKGQLTAYSQGVTAGDSKVKFGRSSAQFVGFTGDAVGNIIHSECAENNPKNLRLVVSAGDGSSTSYEFNRTSGHIRTSSNEIALGKNDGDKLLISSGHHLYFQVGDDTVFRVLSSGRLDIAKGGIDASLLDGKAAIDISGSAANADKLDGQHGSYYRNASNLNAGTLPTARLGTGSSDTNWALQRMASAPKLAIGTYAFLMRKGEGIHTGQTYSGSNLITAAVVILSDGRPAITEGQQVSGTWLSCGGGATLSGSARGASLFLRIA